MTGLPGMDTIFRSKYKAIGTLFPYAIRLEKAGQQEMIDAILCAARASNSIFEGFKWRHIGTYITMVFDESSPPSLDRTITFASPHIHWNQDLNTSNAVTRWAAAVLAVPYSEEVVQSAANTLLGISGINSLQQYIPADIWMFLTKRPSLPPVCWGRSNGSRRSTVTHVRGLRNIEILKSYLLLVWSEWDCIHPSGLVEMQASIKEDFGGIEMWWHRDDLIKRLNYIQRQLDLELEYFKEHQPHIDEDGIRQRKEQYGELKIALLEAEREAMKTLTRKPSGLNLFKRRTNSRG